MKKFGAILFFGMIAAVAAFLIAVFTFEPAHARGGDPSVVCEKYLAKENAPFPDFWQNKWKFIRKFKHQGGSVETIFFKDTTRPNLPVAAIVSRGENTDVAGATVERMRISWWHTYPDGRTVIRTARKDIDEMVCEKTYDGVPPRISQ